MTYGTFASTVVVVALLASVALLVVLSALTLEQFAVSLNYVAPCTHGRLLRRSQKEDSGSRTPARHGQERGCSHLRGESFLGQTLRQSSSRRTLALSGEGTWQATEAL